MSFHSVCDLISQDIPLGQLSNFFGVKLRLFTYPSVKSCVLGAQKNRLIETVLLVHTTYVLVEK